MSTIQDLLLIPGLLCTGDLFSPQTYALSQRVRAQISDHTTAASMPAIAASILATAPARFALCGLSMGGYIAFEILRQAPQRVTRLALLDTSAKPDTPERSAARRQLVARAEAEGISAVSESLFPQWVHQRRAKDEPLKKVVTKMAEKTGVMKFARQMTAIAARADSRPTLSSIRVPTLVLVGREDAATPVAEAEAIADGIAGSTLKVLDDCGHLSTLEQPDLVTDALLRWLDA